MWNYGQLQESDEKEYIQEIFRLKYEHMHQLEYSFLSEQIAKAQTLIRRYAGENLVRNACTEEDAELFAQSTVSQRDIQRVFTLYSWLKKWFKKLTKYGDEGDFRVSVRAVFVSLALVYYFRLSNDSSFPGGGFRDRFKQEMQEKRSIGECGIPVTFQDALKDELKWVTSNIDLPKGIAPTEALTENMYAIIVCTMTKIPVIIVGPPGSSKTLSFNIVIENFFGTKFKNEKLREPDIFKNLDPHFYQCSRKSTSHEIEVVFHRAITRQKAFAKGGINNQAVVLMDEAGIPEYTHESLKVLHYFLDKPEVSIL